MKKIDLTTGKRVADAVELWLNIAGIGWTDLKRALPKVLSGSASNRAAVAFFERVKSGRSRFTIRDLWELSRGLAWARDTKNKEIATSSLGTTSANKVLCHLLYILDRGTDYPVNCRSLSKCSFSNSQPMIVEGTHKNAFKWSDLTDGFRGEKMLVGLLEGGPNALPRYPQMHFHVGEEAICVLRGKLEFYIHDTAHPRMIELAAGQAVVFHSAIPHMVRFLPEETAMSAEANNDRESTLAAVAYYYPKGLFTTKDKGTKLRKRQTYWVPGDSHGTFVESAVVQQLKYLRESTAQITAADIAKSCGLAPSYVTRMEQFQFSPHIDSIEKIKNECFDLSWSDILPLEPLRLSSEIDQTKFEVDRREHIEGYKDVGLELKPLCSGATTHLAIAAIKSLPHSPKTVKDLRRVHLGSHVAQEAIIVMKGKFRFLWYPRDFELFDHSAAFPTVSREYLIEELEKKHQELLAGVQRREIDVLDAIILSGIDQATSVQDFVRNRAIELCEEEVLYVDSSRIYHLLQPIENSGEAILIQWTPNSRGI